ncbi:MAG: GNAT family N-acetyltransferase [Janthinobacterium lividum]
MQIEALTSDNARWQSVAEYAQQCSWKAGLSLANLMREHRFSEWERVFVAHQGDAIAGYCTLAKTDGLPAVDYTPFIGFVFVGEAYRGHRISEMLIRFALDYARTLNFQTVYVASREEGLYEKYGFELLAKQKNESGQEDQIFKISTK